MQSLLPSVVGVVQGCVASTCPRVCGFAFCGDLIFYGLRIDVIISRELHRRSNAATLRMRATPAYTCTYRECECVRYNIAKNTMHKSVNQNPSIKVPEGLRPHTSQENSTPAPPRERPTLRREAAQHTHIYPYTPTPTHSDCCTSNILNPMRAYTDTQ